MAWGNLATLHVALWLRPGLPPGGPPAALDAPPPASPPKLAAPAAAACPTPATRRRPTSCPTTRRTTASMNLSLRFQARLRVLPNIGSALPYTVAVDNSPGLHRCWKAATLVPPASRARADPPSCATLVQTRAASRAQPACASPNSRAVSAACTILLRTILLRISAAEGASSAEELRLCFDDCGGGGGGVSR